MKHQLPFAVALLMATAFGVFAGGAAATSLTTSTAPDNVSIDARYDASISFRPDVTTWLDGSEIGDCLPTDTSAVECELAGRWYDHSAPLTGAVYDRETGATGDLRATCNISGYGSVLFTIAPPEDGERLPVVDLTGAGGYARVRCAWRLRMNDGAHSTLVGIAGSDAPLTAVDPSTALVGTGTQVKLDAVAGTGAFSGLVGGGSVVTPVTFSMLGDTGELPIDFEIVTLEGSGARAARAAKSSDGGIAVSPSRLRTAAAGGGEIEFSLRSGDSGLRVSAPASVRAKRLGAVLVGATAPGARCKATATRGDRRISLGEARAGADGLVRFKQARKTTPAPGFWLVTVRCVAGGKAVRDSLRVKVTR